MNCSFTIKSITPLKLLSTSDKLIHSVKKFLRHTTDQDFQNPLTQPLKNAGSTPVLYNYTAGVVPLLDICSLKHTLVVKRAWNTHPKPVNQVAHSTELPN